jgi:hypothetical protein
MQLFERSRLMYNDQSTIIMRRVSDAFSKLRLVHDDHKQLDEVTGPAFFEEEKLKIEMIKSLVKSGTGKRDALNALLNDFDSDNGIQYFNKIRWSENMEPSNYYFEKNLSLDRQVCERLIL